MVKNKNANKWLGMLVAVTMALGMLTNALPVPAGIGRGFERDQHDRNGLYVCKPERCFGQNRKGLCHRHDGDKQNGCRSHKDPGQ